MSFKENLLRETLTKEKKDIGLPYLKLQVNSETQIAIPMKNTKEVLTAPTERVTLMPNMPRYIIGLINQRNRVFWVADLALILGLSSTIGAKTQFNIAIIQVKNIPLGLIVQEIKGVTRILQDSIKPSLSKFPTSITEYCQGYVNDATNNLLILHPRTLINSPILQQIY